MSRGSRGRVYRRLPGEDARCSGAPGKNTVKPTGQLCIQSGREYVEG